MTNACSFIAVLPSARAIHSAISSANTFRTNLLEGSGTRASRRLPRESGGGKSEVSQLVLSRGEKSAWALQQRSTGRGRNVAAAPPILLDRYRAPDGIFVFALPLCRAASVHVHFCSTFLRCSRANYTMRTLIVGIYVLCTSCAPATRVHAIRIGRLSRQEGRKVGPRYRIDQIMAIHKVKGVNGE